MNRKTICPVCNKVFEVFLRNQVCCCREHQVQWAKIVKQRWSAVHRILPDDLDWANWRLETALYHWRAHARACEKITCEALDLREKLAVAEDKVRELEDGQSNEIARLEKELAARTDESAHAGKMLAVAKEELGEARGKIAVLDKEREQARLLEKALATAKDEIASLTRERDEARGAAAQQKAGKFRNICANCGKAFSAPRKDEKFCCDQCFHEHASMGLM